MLWILFKPLGWHQFFSPNHKQSKHHKNTELLAGQRKHVYVRKLSQSFTFINATFIQRHTMKKGIKHKRNFSLTQTRGTRYRYGDLQSKVSHLKEWKAIVPEGRLWPRCSLNHNTLTSLSHCAIQLNNMCTRRM